MNKKIGFAILGGMLSLGMSVFGMNFPRDLSVDRGVKPPMDQSFMMEWLSQAGQEVRPVLVDLPKWFRFLHPVPSFDFSLREFMNFKVEPINLPTLPDLNLSLPPIEMPDLKLLHLKIPDATFFIIPNAQRALEQEDHNAN